MLRALFSKPEEVRAQASMWGSWDVGVMSSWSGSDVSATSAMQLLAVYGSVRLIAESISTLPVDVFRKVGDLKEEVAKPSWIANPTMDLDFTAWSTQVLTSLLLHGNAYINVVRFGDGRGISELIPLDPTVVRVRREQGRKTFMVNGQRFPGEILHIKGMMMPGAEVGCSPVEAARQSIGVGIATAKYGAEYFENEGNMPGVIELPRPAQPETLRVMAESWRRKRTKGGRGLPGVLPDGAVWKATGVTNEQAQFLSTRKFTAGEIAGQMFLLDPTELGIGVDGQTLTYQNLAQRNARKYEVTFQPWIVRIESALSGLMAAPRYFKFNVNARLRGDLETRYASYAVGIGAGFLEANEARDWEDLPPIDVAVSSEATESLTRQLQQIYLAVGTVITADEAREILNRNGAGLTGTFAPSAPPEVPFP